MKKTRDPFDLQLTDEQRRTLALFCSDQITDGLSARSMQESEVDYWYQLYEQARTRTGRAPWPDAADLTSWLPSEKVDALHARMMRAVWQEPVCTVTGWGDAADRAPFVEEFHQWKAEEERLQSIIDKWFLQALIEPRGLIEVAEGTELRTTRKTIQAKVQTDPTTGGILYDEHMAPAIETNPDGTMMEAGPEDISAEQVIDEKARVRTGPVYRILPYKDSLILPGHARDKDDIWGYGKRFWRPLSALKERVKAGIYDAEAVDKLTTVQDKESDPALNRAHQDVAPQNHGQSDKELWELLILIDLDDLFQARGVGRAKSELRGRRWYLATVHLPTITLLRIQHDDLERSRFVPMILFPRTDRVTEGYSFVGHKLVTVTEEHTAWRNMAADRAAMQIQAPIKRLQGALWDPAEQPWGPKSIIDVRDMREVEPVQVPDYTAPVMNHIVMVERAAERIAGINDVASGQVAQQNRTLGEVQMATEQSFVRMDLCVRRAQEAVEDLYQIRHAIWKRVLAEQPDGMDAPADLTANLEGRGLSIDQSLPDGKITGQLLAGAFRFKPHGSVETADPAKRRGDWLQFVQTMLMLRQAFPIPSQNPITMARAVWRESLRVFHVENHQAFIGSPEQDLQATMQANLMPMLQQLMGGGMAPGMAPGGAGMPPGPQGAGGPPMPPGLPPGPPQGTGGPPGAPPMGAGGPHP